MIRGHAQEGFVRLALNFSLVLFVSSTIDRRVCSGDTRIGYTLFMGLIPRKESSFGQLGGVPRGLCLGRLELFLRLLVRETKGLL